MLENYLIIHRSILPEYYEKCLVGKYIRVRLTAGKNTAVFQFKHRSSSISQWFGQARLTCTPTAQCARHRGR